MPRSQSDPGPAAMGRSAGHAVFPDDDWRWLADILGLSKRQLQIVQCIFDDEVEAGISRRLGISEHTVHTYVDRLYRKLAVSSRCELLVRVFEEYLRRHPPGGARQKDSGRSMGDGARRGAPYLADSCAADASVVDTR